MQKTGKCRFLAVGDIMLHGNIAAAIQSNNDQLFPFRPVMPLLKNKCILFGNLETPITQARIPAVGSQGKYFSSPGTGEALKKVGFDVVNLAHNHILDWGNEGVETTIKELKGAGMAFGGIAKTQDEAAGPVYLECQNCQLKFAFLFYTLTYNTNTNNTTGYVCCPPTDFFMKKHIQEARSNADILVVSIHGGMCMNNRPSPEMRNRCRMAAEFGADVVLGHHSHVPQGYETINNKIIAYGLPDFIRPLPLDATEAYGIMRKDHYESYILEIFLSKKPPAARIMPCLITGEQQTRPSTSEEGVILQGQIESLSGEISTGKSDTLYYSGLNAEFDNYFGKGILRQLKQGGIKWLILRLRTIKPHHLFLLLSVIKRKLFQSTR